MKHSLFLLIFLAFLSLLLPVANAEDAAEWMPDANLRKAVKRSLGLAEDAELTTDDMADLVELKAAARGITDITGLEHAVNLRIARLAGNTISDITVLSGLTGLEVLRLDRNQITDLTVLSNLTNLRELFIRNNAFTDVDPLLGLTNLRILRISGNSLQKTAHLLSRLTGLTFIDITIPPPPNSVPVFTEGDTATRSIAENTVSDIDIGTPVSATDADNDALTYSLSGTDASVFDIEPTTGQLQTSGSLDYEAKSTYTVTVSISDGNGGSADISVTISVTDVDENRAPVFSDGSSTTRSIAENTAADVDIGTPISATDADSDTLMYSLSGTDASAFSLDTASGQLSTKSALDYETKSTYTITISVSDGNGGSASISVTITITDVVEVQAQVAQEPEATGHSILLSHNATVTAGASVWVSATVIDAEDQVVMDAPVTFSVSPDDGKASLNPTSALPGPFGAAFTTLTVDSDAAATYTLTATLEDGTSESGTITVQHPPVFTDGDSTTRGVIENTASGVNIGAPVSATDPNGDTLTYRLGGADAASFRIQSATGQLQTSAPLDYETQNTYTLEVTVSDGTLTDTIAVTIPVTNVNEAPVFNEGTATTRSTAENTASGVNIGDPILATDADGDTLTYTLGGTDAASFRIDSTTGQLQTSAPLDYEMQSAYTVKVTVSDRNTAAPDSETALIATITVTIRMADSVPVFSEGAATTRRIAENTASGTNIGDPVSATDADGDTLTYTLGGANAASFRIQSATGQLQTSAPLDYETQSTYTVEVTVSGGESTATIAVAINVMNVNEAPVFSEGAATTRSIAENTASGTNIGAPIVATDPDGDTLTYSLGGTDAASFEIQSDTGQLQTSAVLDYETRTTYTVEVTVSDRDAEVEATASDTERTATITVTISVTEVAGGGVCDRTPQVRDAIVAAAGVAHCSLVTAEHLAAIEKLNLESTGITALKTGDFSGLSILEELNLYQNSLSSLPADIFEGLSALRYLELGRNRLSSLPADIFDGLSALEHIRLGRNRLSSLPADIFDGLSALKELHVNYNYLSSLPVDIFDGLSALEKLRLNRNSLRSLPVDIFDGLSALKHLDLNDVYLSSLPVDIFDGLSALEHLDLGRNFMKSVPENVFDGLTALKDLSLAGNVFRTLPEDIFDGLSALADLNLSSNQLTSLPVDVFDGLSALGNIELQYNSLAWLPSGVFEGLSLYYLGVFQNFFGSFPNGMFKGILKLKYFQVDGPRLIIALEKVGTNQFKFVVPAGAPFDMDVSATITNGGAPGSRKSVTIGIGEIESKPFTVTRTPGTTGPVTATVSGYPVKPSLHDGYTINISRDLPLTIFEAVPAAPSINGVLIDPTVLQTLEPTALERLLEDLLAENDGSLRYTQAIATVESVLDTMHPSETQLLVNYPNPFNPETWIPYHLAKPVDVQIVIYDARGSVVRRLDLGHCRAGYYTSKSRAAHWDGRNDFGERVSSGVYFYQLQAGNISALRKMLLLK